MSTEPSTDWSLPCGPASRAAQRPDRASEGRRPDARSGPLQPARRCLPRSRNDRPARARRPMGAQTAEGEVRRHRHGAATAPPAGLSRKSRSPVTGSALPLHGARTTLHRLAPLTGPAPIPLLPLLWYDHGMEAGSLHTCLRSTAPRHDRSQSRACLSRRNECVAFCVAWLIPGAYTNDINGLGVAHTSHAGL